MTSPPKAEASSSRRMVFSGIYSLAIKVAGAVLSYASIVAFARMMSPEEYGRFAFGMNAAIILAALGNIGTSTGIMRYWPKFLVAGDAPRAKGAVELGYLLCLAGGTVLLAGAILFSLARMALGLSNDMPLALAIGLLGLMINFGDYSTNLLRAQGSTFVSMLPRDVFWRIAAPALGFVFLWLGLGLSGTTALVVSAAVLLILNLWQGRHVRLYVAALGSHVQALRELKALLPSLLPIWLSGVVYAMIQQFDVVIVGSLLSKADAGAYFAAQKTAMMLSLVLIAGGLATAPAMASLFHAGKLQELQRLCQKLALAIAATTLLGYALLGVIGGHLLRLFDPSFVAAYPILMIVGLGTVIDAVSGPNSYLMQMTNYERPYLKIMLGCYPLVVIAQLLLVPHYGAVGAAIASASGVILWNVCCVAFLRRRAHLDPSILGVMLPPAKPV